MGLNRSKLEVSIISCLKKFESIGECKLLCYVMENLNNDSMFNYNRIIAKEIEENTGIPISSQKRCFASLVGSGLMERVGKGSYVVSFK